MHQEGVTHHCPNLRRNFWMHCLEGGFYMAGLAFLAPETALPGFVKSLGGSDSLIALTPVLLTASFAAPGLFVAPFVERLRHLKPFVVLFGGLQRLPYLLTALVLFFAPKLHHWLLPIVVLTPVVSGLVGGIGVNAWMEMVTRMIPGHFRASGWATRYLIQGTIGLSAGPVIHFVLDHRPGAQGFAWLHLICFCFLVLSYIAQWQMIETPHERSAQPPRPSYGAYLRELPRMLRSQPPLIKFIFARFTGMGYLMMLAFLAIHALSVTHRPEKDVGYLVLASMIGALAANILAGWWGNRRGGRIVMIFARVLCLALCLAVPWITSFTAFWIVFSLCGFGLYADRVGDLTLAAELCPPERRPTYQAILSFSNVVALITAELINWALFDLTHKFSTVALLSGTFAVASLVILCFIPETRKAPYASPALGENPPLV